MVGADCVRRKNCKCKDFVWYYRPVVEGSLSSGSPETWGWRGPGETGTAGTLSCGRPPPLSHRGRAGSCCCRGGPRHCCCHRRSNWAGRRSERESLGCLGTRGHLEKTWMSVIKKKRNSVFSHSPQQNVNWNVIENIAFSLKLFNAIKLDKLKMCPYMSWTISMTVEENLCFLV